MKSGRPKISVITPTNDPRWLRRTADSLLAQTFPDWEWIILRNGAALQSPFPLASGKGTDPRFRLLESETGRRVGALKREACALASADLIVELDHDDELADNALEEVNRAFTEPGVGFVYSQCTFLEGEAEVTFPADQGWEYEAKSFGSSPQPVKSVVNPPLLPQNIARLSYAPFHVRAWRKDRYFEVGGHTDLPVCEDQDLICRMFLNRSCRFYEIRKCLYRYHYHSRNTSSATNVSTLKAAAEALGEDEGEMIAMAGGSPRSGMERLSHRIYDKYIDRIAAKYWGGALRAAAIRPPASEGWEGLGEGASALAAVPENSVGALYSGDALASSEDPIAAMGEAHRCLTHGGILFLDYPVRDARCAYTADGRMPKWNLNTLLYFCQDGVNTVFRTRPAYRYQPVRIQSYLADEPWAPAVSRIRAQLAVVKDGRPLHGERLFPRKPFSRHDL